MVIKTVHIDTTRYLIKLVVIGKHNASITKHDKFKLNETLNRKFSENSYDNLKERITSILEDMQKSDANFKVITEQTYEQILNSDIIQDISRKY